MNIEKKHIVNGGFLIGAVAGSNFLNFLFNALLGRWLSFENFGLVTLIITFYSISSLVTNALAGTINFTISKSAHILESNSVSFLRKTLYRSGLYLGIATCVWLVLMPITMNFFQVKSPFPLLAFIPVLIFSVITYACIGYFQGRLQFVFAGILMLSEPIMKLLAGVFFTFVKSPSLSYLSIPVSLLFSTVIAVVLLKLRNPATKEIAEVNEQEHLFPRKFFLVAIAVGIGSTLFFTIDLLLVKHFFSPVQTGQYALISLIGRMVYFFAALANMFTLPLVSRMKDPKQLNRLFILLLSATSLLGIIGWLTLGVFGSHIVPLLFGLKSIPILPLLPIYTAAISLYVLSSAIASFHLARQEYLFSYPLIVSGLFVAVLIIIRHANFFEVTTNVALTSFLLVISLISMHLLYKTPGEIYEYA